MKALMNFFSRDGLMVPIVIALAVIFSSLAVVRTKHENRALVNDMEVLRKEQERLNMEWAQLQLEEATLAHHARIEKVSRDQLGMTEPREYVVVKDGVVIENSIARKDTATVKTSNVAAGHKP